MSWPAFIQKHDIETSSSGHVRKKASSIGYSPPQPKFETSLLTPGKSHAWKSLTFTKVCKRLDYSRLKSLRQESISRPHIGHPYFEHAASEDPLSLPNRTSYRMSTALQETKATHSPQVGYGENMNSTAITANTSSASQPTQNCDASKVVRSWYPGSVEHRHDQKRLRSLQRERSFLPNSLDAAKNLHCRSSTSKAFELYIPLIATHRNEWYTIPTTLPTGQQSAPLESHRDKGVKPYDQQPQQSPSTMSFHAHSPAQKIKSFDHSPILQSLQSSTYSLVQIPADPVSCKGSSLSLGSSYSTIDFLDISPRLIDQEVEKPRVQDPTDNLAAQYRNEIAGIESIINVAASNHERHALACQLSPSLRRYRESSQLERKFAKKVDCSHNLSNLVPMPLNISTRPKLRPPKRRRCTTENESHHFRENASKEKRHVLATESYDAYKPRETPPESIVRLPGELRQAFVGMQSTAEDLDVDKADEASETKVIVSNPMQLKNDWSFGNIVGKDVAPMRQRVEPNADSQVQLARSVHSLNESLKHFKPVQGHEYQNQMSVPSICTVMLPTPTTDPLQQTTGMQVPPNFGFYTSKRPTSGLTANCSPQESAYEDPGQFVVLPAPEADARPRLVRIDFPWQGRFLPILVDSKGRKYEVPCSIETGEEYDWI